MNPMSLYLILALSRTISLDSRHQLLKVEPTTIFAFPTSLPLLALMITRHTERKDPNGPQVEDRVLTLIWFAHFLQLSNHILSHVVFISSVSFCILSTIFFIYHGCEHLFYILCCKKKI
jgi:hypothetical protein